MIIVGMTDDRELLKFMPPMPKISGSVMRALIALSGLSGLRVGNSQMIEKQVDISTDSATMWISILVVIVVMFMNFGLWHSGTEETEIDEMDNLL